MIEDWYEEGREEVITEIADIIRQGGYTTEDVANNIYLYLIEFGFIDYDTEKDIFYEWFQSDKDVAAGDVA